jgi:soluble lytic murein transglycosylase-like protein
MSLKSLPSPATVVTVRNHSPRRSQLESPASASASVRPEASITIARLARQLVIAAVAAATVVVTASQVHPVYLGRASVADRVLAAGYLDSSATARAPWLTLPEPLAMRHPQFRRDVAAFAADLRGTGQVEDARADSIARVAVREAYHRRIPPALVLGVMLTENDQFKRSARSKVGALGLMQIMPRLWTPNLGAILGRDLKDDETNLRYGVYILMHFAKRTSDTLDAAGVIRTALLSYNGCVHGSNTPDCRAYPEKVRQHVEDDARNVCGGRAFRDCVALPLWAALRDSTPPSMPASTLAGMTIESPVTDRVRERPRTVARAERMGNYLLGLVSARAD